MRKGALLLATTLMATMLLACGGGGAGPPATIPPAVRDQLSADAAVLQLSDLPERFATLTDSSSSDSSSSDIPQGRDPTECLDAPSGDTSATPELVVTAKARRQYVIGARLDAIIVSGRVEVFRDAAAAGDRVKVFGRPAVTDCLKALYVQQLTAIGGTVGDVTVAPAKVEGLGDEQTGFVLSFTATIEGIDHPFAIEFDFTRVNRAGVTVSVFSPRGLDHALSVSAMTAMVNRLQG
jgi:hypothetical protein